MSTYQIRVDKEKRNTNIKTILQRHNIKQYVLAQEADMEDWQISKLCTGQHTDMLLSTSKRVCNAINDIIDDPNITYTLHDVFGD